MMQYGSESPFAVFAKHQKSPPVDVDGIARDLGIKIYRDELGDTVSGMLVRDRTRGGPSGFAIFLNKDNPQVRQRFTLAHEIAHFVLHRDFMDGRGSIVDDTMYRSTLGGSYETQANRLAADILMPVSLIKKFYQRTPDVDALAQTFAVSRTAMEIRVGGLRLSEAHSR